MQNLLLNETLQAGPSYKPLHPLGSDTHILYLHYPATTHAYAHMCGPTHNVHANCSRTFPSIHVFKKL